MSMLTAQIDKLRLMSYGQAARGEFAVATLLREAADTIENLRDRLQELQGVRGESRYMALFGTPERAARTLAGKCSDCCECVLANACEQGCNEGCLLRDESDFDALLEWLRGEDDGEEETLFS